MQRVVLHELGYLHRFHQGRRLPRVVAPEEGSITACCSVYIAEERKLRAELLEDLQDASDLGRSLSVDFRGSEAELVVQIEAVSVRFVVAEGDSVRVEHRDQGDDV